jgi:hypothetical protein
MKTLIRGFLEVDHIPPPDAFLEKPVDPQDLLAIALALLERSVLGGDDGRPSRLYTEDEAAYGLD